MCNGCFRGHDGPGLCKLCGKDLRFNNVSGYCGVCSNSGEAYRHMKEENERAKSSKSANVRSDSPVVETDVPAKVAGSDVV